MYRHPNYAIYVEFQRMVVTNHFLFTQGAITLAAFALFGPIAILAYMGAWFVLLYLSLAFERPYRLLRALWPRANWPAQVYALPNRWKVSSVVATTLLVVGLGTSMWMTYFVIFPFFDARTSGLSENTCIGLVCLLLK
jgi:hypothetical protein